MAITHEISLQEAIDLTARYRNNRPAGFPICETFEATTINRLMATTGCKFLRIYLGMKEDMTAVTVLVAANEENEDILPSGEALTANDPLIAEDGYACPPVCPKPSPLNS